MARRTRAVAALALLPVVLSAACDSFLDVNKNPNAPIEARIDVTMPAVIGLFGHSVLSGSLAFWTAEWMQQFSFNGNNRSYSNVHRYELSAIDANNPWNVTFATVMKEARNVMRDAETAEDWAYHGVAKFLFAWSFSIVTDAWGPVPFTQAFNTAIRDPDYDEQKTVYDGVFTQLNEAIQEMQRPSRSIGTGDLLYHGDISKWVKLARTVEAQLHLRLSSAPGENKTDRAQKALTALQQGMKSNADDADFAYPGGNNRRNPWYTFRSNNDGTFVSSEFFIEMLKARSDPRLPVFARPAPSDTPAIVYRGHRSGSGGQTNNQFSRIGNYFAGDSASLNWVSYAHALFLEAEARLIVSGAAAADAPYRAAIRASMEKLGVAPAAITAYLNARPALNTLANPLEEIIQEKYVANFLKYEAWNDWRRTGYPRVPVVESEYLDQIPQRIRSPDSETTNNAEKLEATGIPTGLTGMLVKVWWASQVQQPQ
jgi:hypothetical protein